MGVQTQRKVTREEYLALEREADEKHEFWDGEIVAMAGASPAHNAICFNLAAILGPQLRGRGCRGYTSDQRVRIPVKERYVYPDLVVVCGDAFTDDDDPSTLVNPTLVVEVLSPGTEARDRGSKLFGYRTLPSMNGCLLVAQDEVLVEYWSRHADGRWLVTTVDDPGATLDLPEIGCTLPIADVYDGVGLLI